MDQADPPKPVKAKAVVPRNRAVSRGVTEPRAKPERARGGEARRIADLMPAIGDQAFRRFGFIQSALVTRWPEIVGAKVAQATQPESLRFARGTKIGGTLRLTVMGAAAPLIQHALPDIIVRVNRFFGYAAVAKVQLLQGAATRSAPAPIFRPIQPGKGAPPPPPNASLRAVADPELRAVLEGLASALVLRDGPPKIG